MTTETTLDLATALIRTGDQITIKAEGLSLLIKRQDEGVSVYTYGSGEDALKEDWTLFSEVAPDGRFETAARALGWSKIDAQDEHEEAFLLQMEGKDDRIEYYGDWEELCLREGIQVEAAAVLGKVKHPPGMGATGPAWDTLPDMTQAESEGWRISECGGLETETARLERDDATAIFSGDAAAWIHVCTQAQNGSAYHQSILDWLKQNAPVEFKRISDHQEALADKTTWAIVNEAGEFWSNEDGWVDQASKTLFYTHEKLVLNLPSGGKWALVG